MSKSDIQFIYWITETHDARSLLKLSGVEKFKKILELKKEFNRKYPNGLIGWRNPEEINKWLNNLNN